MVILQGAGLWHQDDVERRISAGYHGMTILVGAIVLLFNCPHNDELFYIDASTQYSSQAAS
jgi:hypothetical protein